jgi:hypothetical protein
MQRQWTAALFVTGLLTLAPDLPAATPEACQTQAACQAAIRDRSSSPFVVLVTPERADRRHNRPGDTGAYPMTHSRLRTTCEVCRFGALRVRTDGSTACTSAGRPGGPQAVGLGRFPTAQDD